MAMWRLKPWSGRKSRALLVPALVAALLVAGSIGLCAFVVTAASKPCSGGIGCVKETGIRTALAGRQFVGTRQKNGEGVEMRAGMQFGPLGPTAVQGFLALGVVAWAVQRVKVWLETPSRPYSASENANSVRSEYDQWTREGVLEHYWGEHIHMGSYDISKQTGYRRDDPVVIAFLRATLGHMSDFKAAKFDFSAEMLDWSGTKAPKRILDVGCGIGGTSRYLAKRFPDAEVIGITLSPEQVARATELAKEAGLTNVKFQVTNALDMTFEDGTFDLVWGCESGEHMPDKKKYIEEMSRVCAPGGNLVVATWCERDPVPPFTEDERKTLRFVYEEWSHPYFISIRRYGQIMEETGLLESVETADWTEQTLPSWRHSIWVGVWSPWYWIKVTFQRPKAFLGFVRDAYTLERYHRAMRNGLLQYGMMKARKKA